MQLLFFLLSKNNLKKNSRKGDCKFRKTVKAGYSGLTIVTWLHIVIFIVTTGIVLVLVCAWWSKSNGKERRKKKTPKTIPSQTACNLSWCTEWLLIYIYLKWLNFKLMVLLISSHPFYKANLTQDVNICSYSNSSKIQSKQSA